MNRWVEVYHGHENNAEIAASGKQYFAQDNATENNLEKYGSANGLLISNLSNYKCRLYLDDKQVVDLGASATYMIEPQDGIYFNLIKVENLDSGNAIPASSVSVRWSRSEIDEGVKIE